LTDVSENPRLLRKEPGTQEIRRTLLEHAKRYYENFLAEQSDDPGLRAEAAAAYFRLAEITRELSPAPAALALCEKALEIREELARQSPENPERGAELATTYSAMGTLYRATGKSDRAGEFHRKARAIQERLVQMERRCALPNGRGSVSYVRWRRATAFRGVRSETEFGNEMMRMSIVK
jgi:tetratricopeptide (TPR) repeat protein